LETEELRKKVDAIKWFHLLDLGHGVITPGSRDPQKRIPFLGLPEDLRGMSVLDIGAWDGAYSFEAERRGASRVLATDYYCWSGPGWGTKDGFNLARQALNSKVEDREIDVLDLSAEIIGTFDLVLFLGVFYHLRNPLLALEHVFSVTAKQLILETHVNALDYPRPAMVFYPGAELEGDETNWWGPNRSCVEALLSSVGFTEVRMFSHDEKLRRMVFHASR